MGLLDKLWDDVVAGPQPEKGLGKLRQKSGLAEDDIGQDMIDRRRSAEFQQGESEARRITQSISIRKPDALQTTFDSVDSPLPSPSPSSPMASPAGREKDNVWRSVFHPGQNKALKKMGAAKFDNVSPNSPSVYDWVVISALDK